MPTNPDFNSGGACKILDVLEENTPLKLKEIMTMDESYSVIENKYEDVVNFINSEVLN